MHPEATRVWRSTLFTVRMLSLVLASIAFSGVLWVTAPPGPGVQRSSAAYLGAAESLVQGHGYRMPTAAWNAPDSTTPLTHYAPGFSTAIALPMAMGFPPQQSARLVEALAAFVTMAVLVALVGDAVGMGTAAALGLALLVMPMMVDLHLMVLSEPLFLALVALTLATMVAAPDTPLAAGLCATGALAVRYAGLGIVAGVAVWAFAGSGPLKARLRRVGLALLPSAVAVAAGVWVAHASGGRVTRHLGFYGGLAGALADAGAVVAQWLVPTAHAVAWVWWPAVPAAIVLVAVMARGARRAHRLWQLLPADLPMQSSTNVPQLVAARVLGASAALGSAYVAALLAARLFVDGAFTFDARVMSPLILIATVAFAVTAATWWRSAGRLPRMALAVLLVAWGAASLAATRALAHESLTYGLDFAGDAWRGSPLLEWARAEGGGHPLYSNWPAVPYLFLDRPARGLPTSGDAATLRAFGDSVAAHDGVVLAFSVDDPDFVSGDSLVAGSGLRVLASFPGGRVLGRAADRAH